MRTPLACAAILLTACSALKPNEFPPDATASTTDAGDDGSNDGAPLDASDGSSNDGTLADGSDAEAIDSSPADGSDGGTTDSSFVDADAGKDTGVDAGVVGVSLSPALVHLVRGETASLTVSVDPTIYIGDVVAQFPDLPAGVTVTGTIDAGSSGTFTLSAATNATLGPAQFAVWVTSSTGTSGEGQGTLLVQDLPGTLDTTFGAGGIARVSFGDVAFRAATQEGIVLLPDGRILLCGSVGTQTLISATQSETTYAIALARLEGDGSADPSFNGTGTVTWNPDWTDVTAGCGVVASSGLILVGGFNVEGFDDYHSMLAGALTPAGAVDSDYATLGAYEPDFGVDSKISAVAVENDGSMLVVAFRGPNAELYRLTAVGDVDPTFGDSDGGNDAGNGAVLFPAGVFVPTASLLSDGRIIALGTTHSATWLERYSANGVSDGTYGDGGSGPALGGVIAGWTTVAPDDSVVFGGLAANEDGGASLAVELAHFQTDGQLDPGFGEGGTSLLPFPGGYSATIAIARGADGQLALALNFASTAGGSSFSAALFQPSGFLDMSFGANGFVTANVGANALASDVAIDPFGRVLVAGSADDPTNSGATDAVVVRYWP